MRVFIAFDIPQDVKKQVSGIVKEKSKALHGIKWVEQENLHITCKFIGEIDEGQLKELVKRLTSVFNKGETAKIKISGFGAFPDFKRPRVLWLGIEKDVEKLINIWKKVENITRELRIGEKEDEYTPHLTIGRVKVPQRVDEHLINYSSQEFSITSLTVYKSDLTLQGPIYTKLAEIKL